MGDTLEIVQLNRLSLFNLGVPPPKVFVLVGQRTSGADELDFLGIDQLEFLVEDVGPFVEPSFLFAEVAANSIDLNLEILAPLEHFFFGVELGLLSNRVRLEPGRGKDLAGL